jgi:hypothetical protein
LYSGAGVTAALVVTVPNAQGIAGASAPTGMAINGTSDFALAANDPALFIFATGNGTIAGWGPPATPISATGGLLPRRPDLDPVALSAELFGDLFTC